jgi:PadR family transcriptional regulator, regulatory protein PadR
MNKNPLLAGLIPLHILHHAAEGEIFGQGMIDELRHHGYSIGPGTLYPMLHRLEERGYLRVREERQGSAMRRYYRATPKGRAALRHARPRIKELFQELVADQQPTRTR